MITCLLLTGCLSSVVKHHKSASVSNATVEPTVPFVTNVETTLPRNSVNPGTYDLTNNIMLIIGTIIMLICFAPLILSFLDYSIEIVRDKISDLINKTK